MQCTYEIRRVPGLGRWYAVYQVETGVKFTRNFLRKRHPSLLGALHVLRVIDARSA